MLFRRSMILLTFILSCVSAPVQASSYGMIKEDFKPLSGYLIMPAGQEYLVDLGTTQGVNAGDLLAVVKEGEKIVHPVTNKVMGTLNEVKAVLKVTRTEKDYAFATTVRESQNIARGDIVKRFEEITAAFWDYTGHGEAIYAELTGDLPALKWAPYEEVQAGKPAQAPADVAYDLTFVLNDNALQVRGPGFQLLKSYQLHSASDSSAVAAQENAPRPQPATRVTWERTKGLSAAGFNATFPGFTSLGSLPDGTLMADFAETAKGVLVASTDGSDIRVFTLEEPLKEVARGDTNLPGKILSVHWWQPDASSDLFLAATVSVDLNQTGDISYPGQKAVGAVFRLVDNQLVSMAEQLPYMLSAFDQDGDSRNELLLGQEFDRDIFFGKVKEVRQEDGQFRFEEPDLKLPRNFPVQGSLITDLTGDGQPEVAWIKNRVLSIFSDGEIVYESPEEMGGSLAQMSYSSNPGIKESSLSTSSFEVSPVAHDLDGDGVPELFVVAAEGDFLKAPGISPGINKSWLTVFKYRDGMFIKGNIGDELDQPLQGLHATDDQVYFVATASPNWLGKSGKSHLLAFPLSR